eukprot:gene39292-48544_t
MYKVFRPYHPTDIHAKVPKYSWNNVTSWSSYDAKLSGNDDTEVDIYDCINNGGSRGIKHHCAYNDGEPGQPLILYKSNRAYLCYYENQPLALSSEQMKADLGVQNGDDLFEVAGCMLRLAFWPTEYLWDEVNKIYQTFEDGLPVKGRAKLRVLRE